MVFRHFFKAYQIWKYLQCFKSLMPQRVLITKWSRSSKGSKLWFVLKFYIAIKHNLKVVDVLSNGEKRLEKHRLLTLMRTGRMVDGICPEASHRAVIWARRVRWSSVNPFRYTKSFVISSSCIFSRYLYLKTHALFNKDIIHFKARQSHRALVNRVSSFF